LKQEPPNLPKLLRTLETHSAIHSYGSLLLQPMISPVFLQSSEHLPIEDILCAKKHLLLVLKVPMTKH
jgi:hypothetical protein